MTSTKHAYFKFNTTSSTPESKALAAAFGLREVVVKEILYITQSASVDNFAQYLMKKDFLSYERIEKGRLNYLLNNRT